MADTLRPLTAGPCPSRPSPTSRRKATSSCPTVEPEPEAQHEPDPSLTHCRSKYPPHLSHPSSNRPLHPSLKSPSPDISPISPIITNSTNDNNSLCSSRPPSPLS